MSEAVAPKSLRKPEIRMRAGIPLDSTHCSTLNSFGGIRISESWEFARYLPKKETARLKVEGTLEAALHFTIKLLFYAYKEPRCNFIISPLSNASSMGILALGSFGNTQKQLLEAVFGLSSISKADTELLKDQMMFFRNKILLPNQDIVFKTILYVNKDVTLEPSYIVQIASTFGAEVRRFLNRQKINKDFAKATQNKVEEVVLNADKDSQLLLVSALHLKPGWSVPFALDTVAAPFYCNNGTVAEVFYMRTQATVNFAINTTSSFTVLEIPTCVCDQSLLIFLPDKGSSIEYLFLESDTCLCETLTKSARVDNMERVAANIAIPSLSLEHGRCFRNFLPSVGVDDAFSSGTANIYAACTNYCHTTVPLTDVVTKTVLELNCDKCFDDASYRMVETDDVLEFTVNRPFFFALTTPLDSNRRLFLAFGYVKNPSECGSKVISAPE